MVRKGITAGVVGLGILMAPLHSAAAQLWQAGAPGEDLGSIAVVFGSVMPQSTLPDGASFASGTAIGGSATWWAFRNLGFRANVVRAQTDGQPGHQFSSVAFEQPVVLLYNADIALRLPLTVGNRVGLSPYVAFGYGGKSYDWSTNRVSAGTAGNTSFGWTAGGGSELRLLSAGWLGLRIEVMNQHSQFEFFEYAGPHSAHEFYREESVVHEVIPGELSFPGLNDVVFSIGLTLNR